MFDRLKKTLDNYGLNDAEMRELSTYNSEVARGLIHGPEWHTRMALLQARYNNAVRRRMGEAG